MHELSIMESALGLALDRTKAAGGTRIYMIRLRIGALSGVVPEALRFAFDSLVSGTAAEGAALEIDYVPARFWCTECFCEFDAEDMLAECPDCHRPSWALRAGRELELATMEIE
jgi:hydrogenase nickel incorporation protein HypA/HybF